MGGGAEPQSLYGRLVAWLSGLVASYRAEKRADELAELVVQLQLLLAKRIALAWGGVTGETAADGFTRGVRLGRSVGSGIGAAVGGIAGVPGLAQGIELVTGLVTGIVLAIVPLEKENLRARVNDEIRSWAPIERYLFLSLVRTLAQASRRKEGAPALTDSWRTDGGGWHTVAGPLYTIAGYFGLESLYERELPALPPTLDDPRTLYVLTAAVAAEDDDARLSDVGGLMATGRTGAGPWYRAAYDAAGRPTAGQLRARARAAGLASIEQIPVGEWARPAIEDALRARGAR